MKRINTVIIALFFAFSFSAVAGNSQLRFPPMLAGETLVYKVTELSKGKSFIPASKVVSSTHSFVEKKSDTGEIYIEHSAEEARRDGIRNKWQFKYSKPASIVKTDYYILEKYTPAGKLFYHEEYIFSNFNVKMPETLTHIASIPYLMCGMDFKPDGKYDVYTWNQQGTPTRVTIGVCGQEKVSVPFATVDAWKACTTIDTTEIDKQMGAMGKIVTHLLPQFTIWYEKNPPNRPLKIHGIFGPLAPGRPEYIQELVSVKKAG